MSNPDEKEDASLQRGYDRVALGFSEDDLSRDGETAVRAKLARDFYGPPGSPGFRVVEAWLSNRANTSSSSQYRFNIWIAIIGIIVSTIMTAIGFMWFS